MPEFFHERSDAESLIKSVADDSGLEEAVVEKDYWVMHCLWGLQRSGLTFELKGGTSLSKGWGIIERFSEDIDIRFDAPPTLDLKSDKPARVKARLGFYDDLAARIKIPGITVARDTAYDDEKAQNGGIGLKYEPRFRLLAGLKPEVLLEVGFDRTAPNEPRDFSSWALDRVLKAGLDVADNRARGVRCFNPEYTLVDKLQTICRRFRQHRDRGDPEKDRPRHFLRHYYDLYMLLEAPRVKAFIGTSEYEGYKKQKLKASDAEEFRTRGPFTLNDPRIYALFESEFERMDTLLLAPGPTFKDLIKRLRKQAF
ncbi:MAG: nucleotidyl transferase AbiEii/AbiGii toxin family protein [Elusimicrobiota bacterium]